MQSIKCNLNGMYKVLCDGTRGKLLVNLGCRQEDRKEKGAYHRPPLLKTRGAVNGVVSAVFWINASESGKRRLSTLSSPRQSGVLPSMFYDSLGGLETLVLRSRACRTVPGDTRNVSSLATVPGRGPAN